MVITYEVFKKITNLEVGHKESSMTDLASATFIHEPRVPTLRSITE